MLLLGAVGLSLFICEAALRMTGRYQTPSYPPICTRPELNQPSALYGYRLALYKRGVRSERRDSRRFLQLSELHSFLPAIIFLPGRADTAVDKARRVWLRQYAKHNAVTFLDLTESIHQMDRQQVFITRNWHLNPHGHQIVATELHRFIVERVLTQR
jgi:hypothetical protein